jgi:hypothetical protein
MRARLKLQATCGPVREHVFRRRPEHDMNLVASVNAVLCVAIYIIVDEYSCIMPNTFALIFVILEFQAYFSTVMRIIEGVVHSVM